tara:strand:- start:17 stop:1339 length:1323 start_codon:yes stop_codon:yes gene_type:complete
MTDEYAITIKNKRIFDFVKNNPDIDLETLNLLMIDFIEKINTNMNKTLINTINKEILNSVKQLESKLQYENSKYVENIKTTIELNSNKETEKINTLLSKNTQEFSEKLNNFTSTSHDKFKDSLNQINSSTINELKDHISKNSGSKEFMHTFETKLQDIQKPMYSFFNTQQEQLIKKLAENDCDKSKQDTVMTQLTDFLNKWKNSSTHKGNYGQNMLEGVLNSAYPSAEVVNTSGFKASGDFILKRESKPTILVENKDYKSNVNNEEVKKFVRDVNEQQTHGIFLSQASGIISKNNYQIDICEGKILVYLHNVEYNPDIIKSAINIIDNLAYKVEVIENDEGETISKEIIDGINSDFQIFLNKKQTALNTAKDIQKRLITQIEELAFPSLADWLDNKGVSTTTCTFECDVCKMVFANKRALASHKKVHKNVEIKNVVIDTT